MMHVNTGCEDDDHSRFAMKNMEYPDFEQDKDGLWCCHQGPPGCSCDIVQYQFQAGTGADLCLGANETSRQGLVALCDHQDWGTATWRETTYTPELAQVEIYGTSGANIFECLGSAVASRGCEVGAPVSLADCGGNLTAVAFSWDEDQSRLTSDSCPGLCIGVSVSEMSAGAPLELQSCDEGTTLLSRIFLD